MTEDDSTRNSHTIVRYGVPAIILLIAIAVGGWVAFGVMDMPPTTVDHCPDDPHLSCPSNNLAALPAALVGGGAAALVASPLIFAYGKWVR